MRSILAIVIACLLLPYSYTAVRSSEIQQQKKKKTSTEKPEATDKQSETLDFSGTGRPGQQTAGESRGNCLRNSQPIAAVLPASNSGKTVLGHPNFWVYFPHSNDKNREVEFTIQDESRNDVWRSRAVLDSTSGYQSFSLPKTEAPLRVGQSYRWYVKVYCGDLLASTQHVQGWVNRVPLNSKLHLELQQEAQQNYITYGKNKIWYDAIDKLLSSYLRYPENLALEKDWHNFTRAKGVNLSGLPCPGEHRISSQKI